MLCFISAGMLYFQLLCMCSWIADKYATPLEHKDDSGSEWRVKDAAVHVLFLFPETVRIMQLICFDKVNSVS